MEWSDFTLFFIASWVLIITPGPDMIYVITRGITQGRAAGVLSAAGVTTGILVHTLFAALGLAVILQTSALAFSLVKYAGALYLIYLGIQSFRKNTMQLEAAPEPATYKKIFYQGVLCNVLNPKVALFFLAFLPQFVDRQSTNSGWQMMFLGLTFAFCGLLFLLSLGYFAGRIGAWLLHNPFIGQKLRWFTGSIMIVLGLRLAVAERI